MTLIDLDPWDNPRQVIGEAHRLGAKFRVVGAEIEVTGDIPESLRASLPAGGLQ